MPAEEVLFYQVKKIPPMHAVIWVSGWSSWSAFFYWTTLNSSFVCFTLTHYCLRSGSSLDTCFKKLWTYHKVGIRLNPACPHPGILLSNGTQPHSIFSIKGGLFVRTTHDYILALGEVADATRVIGESPVFSNLSRTKREGTIKQDKNKYFSYL